MHVLTRTAFHTEARQINAARPRLVESNHNTRASACEYKYTVQVRLSTELLHRALDDCRCRDRSTTVGCRYCSFLRREYSPHSCHNPATCIQLTAAKIGCCCIEAHRCKKSVHIKRKNVKNVKKVTRTFKKRLQTLSKKRQ